MSPTWLSKRRNFWPSCFPSYLQNRQMYDFPYSSLCLPLTRSHWRKRWSLDTCRQKARIAKGKKSESSLRETGKLGLDTETTSNTTHSLVMKGGREGLSDDVLKGLGGLGQREKGSREDTKRVNCMTCLFVSVFYFFPGGERVEKFLLWRSLLLDADCVFMGLVRAHKSFCCDSDTLSKLITLVTSLQTHDTWYKTRYA